MPEEEGDVIRTYNATLFSLFFYQIFFQLIASEIVIMLKESERVREKRRK